MATMWRKAMLYLGLGPDEEYEDYDAMPDERSVAPREPAPAPAPRPAPAPQPRQVQPQAQPAPSRPRPAPAPAPSPFSTPPPQPDEPPAVRTLPLPNDEAPKPRVRAVPRIPQVKPHLVTPTSFNHAQEVADSFKDGEPVALDLLDADRDLSRRLIDFSSGLCYGLAGRMEKVADHLYLLTPSNVEVTAEERRRLADRSFDL